MKKIYFFLVCAFSTFSLFGSQIEAGDSKTITEPVFENLYVAAGSIVIAAPIHGDLVLAGGKVVIQDSVVGDVLVIGGDLNLQGTVEGDVRCVGGNITFNKSITGDALVTGGRIWVGPDATITNVIVLGGELHLNGNINGFLKCFGGSLEINGSVLQHADIRGNSITLNGTIYQRTTLTGQQVTIGERAAFYQDVRYWIPGGQLNFKQSLKNSRAIFDESLRMPSANWYLLGAASVLFLIWFVIMALLMIWLIQQLFGRAMHHAAITSAQQTLKSFGYGALFFIGMPLAAVLALVTVIGVPLGVVILFIFTTGAMLGTYLTAVVIANWWNIRRQKGWNTIRLVLAAWVVYLIMKLIGVLPILGWLFQAIVVATAMGALLLSIPWKWKDHSAESDEFVNG